MSLLIQKAFEGAVFNAITQNKISNIDGSKVHREGVNYDKYPDCYIELQLVPARSSIAISNGSQSHSGIYQINVCVSAGNRENHVKAYQIAADLENNVFSVASRITIEQSQINIIGFSVGPMITVNSEQKIPCSIEYTFIK